MNSIHTWKFECPGMAVSALSFSSDGQSLAIGGSTDQITILNIPTKRISQSFTINEFEVHGGALCLSLTDSHLVLVTEDERLICIELDSEKQELLMRLGEVRNACSIGDQIFVVIESRRGEMLHFDCSHSMPSWIEDLQLKRCNCVGHDPERQIAFAAGVNGVSSISLMEKSIDTIDEFVTAREVAWMPYGRLVGIDCGRQIVAFGEGQAEVIRQYPDSDFEPLFLANFTSSSFVIVGHLNSSETIVEIVDTLGNSLERHLRFAGLATGICGHRVNDRVAIAFPQSIRIIELRGPDDEIKQDLTKKRW